MSSRIFLIALVGAVLTWISPASAYPSAPMNFCNKTARTVAIAYAYHSPGVNDPSDKSILTGPLFRKVEAGNAPTDMHNRLQPFRGSLHFLVSNEWCSKPGRGGQ